MTKYRYGHSSRTLKTPIVEPPFVCYVLCYPHGEPFYVGAGFRSRVTDWLDLKGSCFNAPAGRVIRSLRARQMEPDIYIALATNNRRAAFNEEKRLIAHYRAAGVKLVNVTDGGDSHRRSWMDRWH